jgi:Fe2+ or Zn2+ uptake regulation protein
VIEFEDCLLEKLEDAIGDRFDFKMQGHLVELYGLCPDCRASARGASHLR